MDTTHLLYRVVADSGKKAVADSSPTPGCALAEGVAQERERCGPEGIVASVLRAEHHLGLVRMQPESDLAEPGSDPLPHVPGLLRADTVHHNVVAVALERQTRKLPDHPPIKGIMQKRDWRVTVRWPTLAGCHDPVAPEFRPRAVSVLSATVAHTARPISGRCSPPPL